MFRKCHDLCSNICHAFTRSNLTIALVLYAWYLARQVAIAGEEAHAGVLLVAVHVLRHRAEGRSVRVRVSEVANLVTNDHKESTPCLVHLYCDDGGSEAQDDQDSRHHLQVLQQLRAHHLLQLSANLRVIGIFHDLSYLWIFHVV